MKGLNGKFCCLAAWMVVLLAQAGAAQATVAQTESYLLPSSAYLTGANAAEYQTNVRVLNQGTSAVTVTATFYDQRTSTTSSAGPFQIGPRSQVAFDNILQSVFGKTLGQAAYGPIRFDGTGPILVAANVNNSGTWVSTAGTSGTWSGTRH